MAITVPTSFIEQYDSEVKQAYQRQGALLRGTTRTRTDLGAQRIYFPKLGKGMATQKARHADVVPMNLEHTRAFADMEDHYAPEYVDKLDMAKLNWSLISEYSKASGWALGRKHDEIILAAAVAAAVAASNNLEADTLADSTGQLSLGVVNEMTRIFDNRDVPADSMRFAIINPQTKAELLAITGATSSDFVVTKPLMDGQAPANWMGWNWIMHTGVPSAYKAIFWHQVAVGVGFAADISTQTDWVAQKAAFLVNSMLSMGAVGIDADGIQTLTTT